MITLRIATEKDAAALSRIYKYYVENTAISFEYIAPDEAEFSQRITHKLEAYPFIVAEDDGKVVGYAYASRFRDRAAYDWSCELSVYIDKNYRGNGIGVRLYGALEQILRLQNLVTLVAGITSPNERSEALHKKMGFTLTGTMDYIGYKNGEWRDVMWYTKVLSHEPPKPMIPFPELDKAVIAEILSR